MIANAKARRTIFSVARVRANLPAARLQIFVSGKRKSRRLKRRSNRIIPSVEKSEHSDDRDDFGHFLIRIMLLGGLHFVIGDRVGANRERKPKNSPSALR